MAQRLWTWAAARGWVDFAAISDATAELAAEHGWDVLKWGRLPPALWSSRVVTKPRRRLSGPLRVVSISRLSSDSRRKNVDVLIEAIATLHHAGRPVELTLIGDGDLFAELSHLANNLAPGVVTFAGRVNDAERSRLLRESHIFALPSEQEGFGLVVLEAWEAGLAVVGCRRRALGEIIQHGETGLTPEPNAVAVAAALIELFDEPKRIRLAIEGQRNLAAKYSPSAFDERLCAIIQPQPTGWSPRASNLKLDPPTNIRPPTSAAQE